jgi:plasmid stabilization system protein ParE
MEYLEAQWTDKEISGFVEAVEKKLLNLTRHPEIGTSRSKR